MSDRARVDSLVDRLLRELRDRGLVKQCFGEPGPSWALTEAAQARLVSLESPPLSADDLIFIGHRCARCGERRTTRFRDGSHLCDSCYSRGLVGERTITLETDRATEPENLNPIEALRVEASRTAKKHRNVIMMNRRRT